VTPSPDDNGISVVVPTLNDRDGLDELIHALTAQTRAPDELVVVDGGSTDGTAELLEAWRDKAGAPLKVVNANSLGIGAARDAGVEAATHEWIACTDAGCQPAPGWLREIDAARGDADFIAGVVLIDGRTPFERALALTHYPSADELDDPGLFERLSHRLFGRGYDPDRIGGAYMAFTKAVWSAVGGFRPSSRPATTTHSARRSSLRASLHARARPLFGGARPERGATTLGCSTASATWPWPRRVAKSASMDAFATAFAPPLDRRCGRVVPWPMVDTSRVGSGRAGLHGPASTAGARRWLYTPALVAYSHVGGAKGHLPDHGRPRRRRRRGEDAASSARFGACFRVRR
jgi:hypothetical protein